MATRRPGPYQIQAVIADLHAEVPTYAQTDWRQTREARAPNERALVLVPDPAKRDLLTRRLSV